jgi:urease accessory protein
MPAAMPMPKVMPRATLRRMRDMIIPLMVIPPMITDRIATPLTIIRRMITLHTIIRHMATRMVMPRMITVRIIMTSIAATIIIMGTPMLMTTNKPRAKSRRQSSIPPVESRQIDRPVAASSANAAEASLAISSEFSTDEAAALYRLMTWLSPSFPVGAFSYSSGIEWAVEAGDIVDARSLENWLGAMLVEGSGFCDGVFLAQAHRAARSPNGTELQDIAELAAAFAPSRERQLETTSQGRAFIEIARAAWNCDGLDRFISWCNGPIVYPVAVGLVSAAHGISLAPTLHAFFHALASNWISAGARLVPLGQTDSQRLLASLEPAVVATTRRAIDASLDDLGSSTFRADLASMRHETQYTRLFRS